MNLTPLFDRQRELDAHILSTHPEMVGVDLLPKKILALQVELGELANEWRGFKFWSNDQAPRRFKLVPDVDAPSGERAVNPLLEEYVDCLHFILSIGLELEYDQCDFKKTVVCDGVTIIDMFRETFRDFSNMDVYAAEPSNANWARYRDGIGDFLALGEMLSFTPEQIEQAYLANNEVNHARQESGY